MAPGEIKTHPAFDKKWYYSLELAPGLFTPGQDHRSVTQTRELLRHVDVESGGVDGQGARCLDIGIQEALVTTLLERRGASVVVGYDRILRHGRLDLVKEALGTDFQLIGDMKLQDLPRALEDEGHGPFDVVVFSGVLYHMFDPLGGLAVVRGFVREGGICLVETTTVFAQSSAMYFNEGGTFTPGGLWFVTPRCLDYLLRLLRLEPLDVVHLKAGGPRDGPRPGRLAVACRAVAGPVAEPGDEWIVHAQRQRAQFAEFLDWDTVASRAPEVGYGGSRAGLVRNAAGSVDLEASIAAMDPFIVDPEQTRLTLDASH